MKADYTWDVCPKTKDLELRITATVEGKVLAAATRVPYEIMTSYGPPSDYIKRDLERQVLTALSKELFGRSV